MADGFDGDAIARADREFLVSLSDHPLVKHPLYGVPCPPQPRFGDPKHDDVHAVAARHESHEKTVAWLVVNYGYHESAFAGKGGAISLVDGEVMTLANLRERMMPWPLLTVSSRGTVKARSPVEDWRMSRDRIAVRRDEMRPDRPRPTFIEDKYRIFNRYRPPVHPTAGGNLATFDCFLERLFPDDTERQWLWHWLAHKTRRPWIPMIGVIMMAEDFGTGRGTLIDILEMLFGADYVVPCNFGELTGASSARFNARLADALIAVVNEAIAEDGQQQATRRLQYEALKNTVEPSPTARQRYEAKWAHAYAQRSARSTIIATNHRDVIKLPRDDRRLQVLTCGRKMTAEETTEIRAWMADPANIGALHRALLSTPAVAPTVFDPFGAPPAFAGRREMISMGRSELEDAYDTAMDLLDGCPLFTTPQIQKLMVFLAGTATGYGSDTGRIRHTIAKRAYRLREREEPNYRIRYHRRREILYASTRAERQRWHDTDTRKIVAALDRTEKRITEIMNADGDPLADLMRLKPQPTIDDPPY